MRFIPINEHKDGAYVYVRGRRDQDGVNWISIQIGSRTGPWQKQTEYRGTSKKAIVALDQAGFNFSLDQFEEIREQVLDNAKFQSVTRFTQPGWTGSKFAFSNGTGISLDELDRSIVGFPIREGHTCEEGTHAKWLEYVAAPLTGCELPEFCLMAMFAAPLLKFAQMPFNFGFELSGPPSTGKTTMAKVCASVAGPIGGHNGSYIETMNSTVNSLDASMSNFNDMPLILEEANLLTLGAGGSADRKYADLIFRMAEGRGKRRLDRGAGKDARFIWLATTNQGWPELARRLDADTAQAVADRMITLPIPSVENGGVYGTEGLGERQLSALSREVVTAAATCHGTAIRHFVRYIQRKLKDEGPNIITERIEKLVSEFCNAAKKKAVDADERLLRAFGLVYAAGRFAVDGQALPDGFKPRKASMRALHRHLDARSSIKSPLQALADLAQGDGVLDLRKDTADATKQMVEDATCVLRKSSGRVELILTAEHLAALEIETPRILDDLEVTALLRRESQKRLIYRHIVPLMRQQVYVFRYDELIAKAHSIS